MSKDAVKKLQSVAVVGTDSSFGLAMLNEVTADIDFGKYVEPHERLLITYANEVLLEKMQSPIEHSVSSETVLNASEQKQIDVAITIVDRKVVAQKEERELRLREKQQSLINQRIAEMLCREIMRQRHILEMKKKAYNDRRKPTVPFRTKFKLPETESI